MLTVSDGVASGTREDLSGEVAATELAKLGFVVLERAVVPDERALIVEKIRGFVDGNGVALIVTTGGTGLGPRDVTPEAVREVLDLEIPGYGELLRIRDLRSKANKVALRKLGSPPRIEATIVSSEIKDKSSPENVTRIRVVMREEGMEWSVAVKEDGARRSILIPE